MRFPGAGKLPVKVAGLNRGRCRSTCGGPCWNCPGGMPCCGGGCCCCGWPPYPGGGMPYPLGGPGRGCGCCGAMPPSGLGAPPYPGWALQGRLNISTARSFARMRAASPCLYTACRAHAHRNQEYASKQSRVFLFTCTPDMGHGCCICKLPGAGAPNPAEGVTTCGKAVRSPVNESERVHGARLPELARWRSCRLAHR